MIRAYVSHHMWGMGTAIAIVHHLGDGELPAQIMRLGKDGIKSWEPVAAGEQMAPTLVLDDAEARAVLDSLTRHFHGAEDTRALRRDYDAERDRVDQLVATVGNLALTLAGQE